MPRSSTIEVEEPRIVDTAPFTGGDDLRYSENQKAYDLVDLVGVAIPSSQRTGRLTNLGRTVIAKLRRRLKLRAKKVFWSEMARGQARTLIEESIAGTLLQEEAKIYKNEQFLVFAEWLVARQGTGMEFRD